MLTKSTKLHITCDETNLLGNCGYEWVGTEEDWNKIMEYDGKSLDHFPNRKQHREYMLLKEGKCPFCEDYIKRISQKTREIVRGGVIPSPRFDNRIPRRNI